MFEILRITLKGVFRDRVFHGIIVLAALFLIVPSVAVLSMRQVTELAMTLSLSLISVILLLLSVFLGATSIWKDVERRYTYSVLSLPISRAQYLFGRFFGIALFLCLTTVVLGLVASGVIAYSSTLYAQDRPFVWDYVILAMVFDTLRFIMLTAIALFLSSLSTSFFLPVFGTLSLYWVGNFSQDVYDYLQSPAGNVVSPFIHQVANGLYYLLPNFSAFDFRVNAIYAIAPDQQGLLLTIAYFFVYSALLLSAASWVLSRKEFR